jgi:hypothetical protein
MIDIGSLLIGIVIGLWCGWLIGLPWPGRRQ